MPSLFCPTFNCKLTSDLTCIERKRLAQQDGHRIAFAECRGCPGPRPLEPVTLTDMMCALERMEAVVFGGSNA